jgi:hypothetical protein
MVQALPQYRDQIEKLSLHIDVRRAFHVQVLSMTRFNSFFNNIAGLVVPTENFIVVAKEIRVLRYCTKWPCSICWELVSRVVCGLDMPVITP